MASGGSAICPVRRTRVKSLRAPEASGESHPADCTFQAVNGLRILLVRRVIVCLALAGLALPLLPAVSARTTATDRLTDALGHREAVEAALVASQQAPDPTAAFLDAYYAASGQDADEVLARLEGTALWLLTDPDTPLAVLVATGAASGALSVPATGAVLHATVPSRAPPSGVRIVTPEAPDAPDTPAPLALRPRGP